MTATIALHHTYEHYLEALDRSAVKLEFCDGLIYAMAGGTVLHGLLSTRVTTLLSAKLLQCTVLNSDVKVHIDVAAAATFPDASVVFGSIQRATIDAHAIVNPVLIVEVTSPSTEDYDRGAKLAQYQRLDSVRACSWFRTGSGASPSRAARPRGGPRKTSSALAPSCWTSPPFGSRSTSCTARPSSRRLSRRPQWLLSRRPI